MSKVHDNLKYTESHEWVRFEGDNSAVIGITDHAQSELTDLVYIELPAIGKLLKQGDIACVVESVKAASDIYSPVSGKVIEVNQELEKTPEIINSDPYGKGWIFKVETEEKGDKLLKPEDYNKLIQS